MPDFEKRLIIIAHPDDEVLWAGGLIAKFPGEWSILLCGSPVEEPWRNNNFLSSCEVLGAKPILLSAKDKGENYPLDLSALDSKLINQFDHIITHGKSGEYGHAHHKQVHEAVIKLVPLNKLTFFAYSFDNRILRPNGDHLINLSSSEVEKKLNALKQYQQPLRSLKHKHKRKKISFWKRFFISKKQLPIVPQHENLYFKFCIQHQLDFSVESYSGYWPFK